MKIEEWIKKVRRRHEAGSAYDPPSELDFIDTELIALRIIEHLLKAVKKYAALQTATMPELQLWMDKGELAQEAIAAAEKEVEG